MFARISSFAALLTLATATVLPRGGGNGAACSDTGTAQCCDSVQNPSDLSPSTSLLLGLLGVVVGDLTADVGLTCSPISVIGVGGTNCDAQTVCCDNNNFNGLIALGCIPINIGL
ncbi:hydrophobin-251 [Desarmillaria tabescens]|uniref:Hydrophobin n=1 Tax=Armillaria tabescens TaxID=1929756 RepID=A0AA39MQV6_ARMTA|nr:hydrophobin-251 [Desarmillaria tabescens]KAK0442699.1 hydrophobin-251 [Desarmillaria tabescens]